VARRGVAGAATVTPAASGGVSLPSSTRGCQASDELRPRGLGSAMGKGEGAVCQSRVPRSPGRLWSGQQAAKMLDVRRPVPWRRSSPRT
jgi:hypothetical protein